MKSRRLFVERFEIKAKCYFQILFVSVIIFVQIQDHVTHRFCEESNLCMNWSLQRNTWFFFTLWLRISSHYCAVGSKWLLVKLIFVKRQLVIGRSLASCRESW